MQRNLLVVALFVSCALAACGGGGGGGGVSPSVTTPPASSNPQPSNNPASTPQQAQVAGSMAFVTSNGMTLYVFGADTANTSNCTSGSGCTGVWPPYTAPAGTVAPAGFGLITRSDGSLQWTINGSPVYTYVGDSAAGSDKGNGLTEFGGLWTTARPTGASPGPTNSPGGNPY